MNRLPAAIVAAGAALLLATGCGNSQSDGKPAATRATASDAAGTFTALAARVSSAKLGSVVTTDNDPNHLLGRPGQYTSKITFADTRIKAADVEGTDVGDVSRGGAIEQFANPDEAMTRAQYIQAITKGMPALTEYDYVHGVNVIRVSRYLTPVQAKEYEDAAGKLP
ncbi:hypothetical protein ACFH04_12195 [Streptomyces noboritoensis]|uniref:Lipoprotein n=1 Tax=Streptomyces noboritoensis TaxID=67337 RepID=A0ABV6TF92_9ACTN